LRETVIQGIHGLLFSSNPKATRAFLRDKLRLPFTDVGGGWLIFDLAEGDLGVHPTGKGGLRAGTHFLSFYCRDIDRTVAVLRSRGVRFGKAIEEQEWGWETYFHVPGGIEMQLYEPKYRKRSGNRTLPRKDAEPRKKV
jgi:catechol 2,3-dioxygenase-like lactoylglutathione lyase family enzyme